MYYTGLDPRTMEPIYVPKSAREKAMQRALIQYRNPANYDLVREALVRAGRQDLIGWDEQCLIRPIRPKKRDEAGFRKGPEPGRGGKPDAVGKGGAPAKVGKAGPVAKKGAASSGKPAAARKPGSPRSSDTRKPGRPSRDDVRAARKPDRGSPATQRSGRLPKATAPGRPGPARPLRTGKPPKANGRKGGIRKGR